MQIFARNPRQWRRSTLNPQDIKLFRKKLKAAKIKPLVVHIPYTLNLAAAQARFHKISIREFSQDLIEANELGADYLVTHMGSYKGLASEEAGLVKIAKALEKILEQTKGVKTTILLENTSGSGRWLGYNFEHIGFILKSLHFSKRVGICVDTTHAWCAGYAINTQNGLNEFLNEIEEHVGLERLKLIHLNDTLDDLDSKKDRHYHIGKGKIGEGGFYIILNHPTLKGLPFILETPKKKENDDYMNLKTVKRLYRNELHKRN